MAEARHRRNQLMTRAHRPNGSAPRILYLDLDGTLHPEDVVRTPGVGIRVSSPSGHALFEHAHILESLLFGTDWLIVLSTSWVQVLGFDATCGHLPAALCERVVGATFHRARKDEWNRLTRDQQVRGDVSRRRPSLWIANPLPRKRGVSS